jgi:hypothetical protein
MDLGVGGPLQIAGLGLDIFGGIEASQAASKKYDAEIQQAQDEIKLNQVKRNFMEMSNRRQQLQQVRQGQVARSMALSNSVSSGSQYGSGLQGAYGEIGGGVGTNIAGLSQSLQFGEQSFDITNMITQDKILEAQASKDQANAMGIASIGSGLMGLGGSKFLNG